jgi:two-component system, cell cycle response regulator
MTVSRGDAVPDLEHAIDPAAPLRLLLVEDEPTQLLILAHKLRQAGYAVDTATNGREALDKLQTGGYSLLLTDWDMPLMDGVELCRALRAAQLPNYVYTLLLTGRDGLDHVVAGLDAGADDYLVKPVEDIELKARLATGRRIVMLEQSLRAANEENRRLSVMDPLTGACNRRYLMDLLPREIERAVRYARPLSLVMCDLDHFKRVNDTHGHMVGDEVLRAAVRILLEGIRKTDWVARYGGEEFIIVLPETSLDDAHSLADQLRGQLEESSFGTGGMTLPVTASFGVVGSDGPVASGSTMDDLIAQCDECLYLSKTAGRNRTTSQPLR